MSSVRAAVSSLVLRVSIDLGPPGAAPAGAALGLQQWSPAIMLIPLSQHRGVLWMGSLSRPHCTLRSYLSSTRVTLGPHDSTRVYACRMSSPQETEPATICKSLVSGYVLVAFQQQRVQLWHRFRPRLAKLPTRGSGPRVGIRFSPASTWQQEEVKSSASGSSPSSS